MFYQWNSMEILELLRDRGEPLDLQVKKKEATEVLITANGCRQARIPTTDVKKAQQQLSAMLINYPQEVSINGNALRREPAPDRARLSRTDYESDTRTVYRFTPLQNPDGVPADGRTQDLLVAGVRISTTGAKPGRTTFFAASEDGGTSHWKPATEFRAETILTIAAARAGELQTDSHGRPEVPRGSQLDQDLQKQAAATLQHAVDQGVCPPPTSEPVFSRTLSMEYTYEDMHDGGAPIVVRGIPVTIDEAGTEGSLFASTLAAMFGADQELVPVRTALANATDQEPRTVQIRRTSADEQDTQDTANPFSPADDAWIEVHLQGEGDDRRIPAAAVVTGEQAYTKNVTYVPGHTDPSSMSDLLTRSFWSKHDFNDAADPGEALADMEQEFLQEATAAMGDPAAAFAMQMRQTLEGMRRIRPQPDQEVTVTSRDGHFRLSWLPEPDGNEDPAS